MFTFGDGVEPNLQEGQCTAGWLEFPAHPHFLNVEDVLDVVRLDLFDCFNHRIDALVLGNHIRDKLDVVSDCDK